MTEVGNNYILQIRRYSWWKSSGTPLRTFVIAHLWHDLDTEGNAFISRVGLLELGFDEPVDIDYAEFTRLFDDRKLIPMNLTPVYKDE